MRLSIERGGWSLGGHLTLSSNCVKNGFRSSRKQPQWHQLPVVRTAYGSMPATPDTTAYAVGQPHPRVRCARWTPEKTTPPPSQSRGKTDTREDDAPLAKIAARRTAAKMTLPPSQNHGKTDERPRRRRRHCTAGQPSRRLQATPPLPMTWPARREEMPSDYKNNDPAVCRRKFRDIYITHAYLCLQSSAVMQQLWMNCDEWVSEPQNSEVMFAVDLIMAVF
jgi:hypothetical protein